MMLSVHDPSDSSGSAPAITLHLHPVTDALPAAIGLLTRAGDGIAQASLQLPLGLAVALSERLAAICEIALDGELEAPTTAADLAAAHEMEVSP